MAEWRGLVLALVVASAVAAAEPPKEASGDRTQDTSGSDETQPIETWGAVEPGKGFLVGKTRAGELYISAYALFRYLNQLPAGAQTFTDHLGTTRVADLRHDFWSHRVMVFFKGWVGVPKLVYQIILWTVNTTDQNAIFGVIGYQFRREFSLYGGLNALPGTRTLTGSHPYWLAQDRVMADEYFRPYFTHGVWASGELVPGLWYVAMIGNNLSALGIKANQLTREFGYSGTMWWMPTTDEFGPNGDFTDFEYHEHLATRFGISGTLSYENRFSNAATEGPDNTTIRLADSLNVFDPGSLAPGVTVSDVRYRLLGVDAGFKYKGMFLQTQYFLRLLDNFRADGPIPLTSILDQGFYVQAAAFPVKQELELYGATSWVFGDKDAGFKTQHEWIGGTNWYFTNSRNIRLNIQMLRVDRSPVSSSFGYYTGGMKGETFTVATSILF